MNGVAGSQTGNTGKALNPLRSRRMGGLLIAGTTSDAGKSIVTTALCRAFARRGVAVAPFKAQNMSNNSMVCVDAHGHSAEIGRAQWIQALAARTTPEPAMNPVLLEAGKRPTQPRRPAGPSGR